ncbi:1455_t:CDS:2 [Dentiscutata erythropus]|uniref:1455_t:CDS:1 n=1 Tax=Dentiscutata erythropus TaxID=1348616 RepID=A0A9N9DVC4_9GLOM|nr:1455_t:CDS:2 [Dentiscutata erythropus]
MENPPMNPLKNELGEMKTKENEEPEPISRPGSSMQTSLDLDDLDELFGVI